jgi:hypothetical protein
VLTDLASVALAVALAALPRSLSLLVFPSACDERRKKTKRFRMLVERN